MRNGKGRIGNEPQRSEKGVVAIKGQKQWTEGNDGDEVARITHQG
jgi:hypothetical protein